MHCIERKTTDGKFSKRIVLAGNPNSGKTTLFNALCRASQHIGNWAGVTVESKTGRLFADKSVEIVDLPGIYSLSPLSPDEKVAGDYLKSNKADLIINIVDGTNLIRNLFLTTQLLEGHKNLLIALNMQDELRQRGYKINAKELEKVFRCKCVSISAANGEGVGELVDYILRGNYKRGISYDFSAPAKEEQAYLRYAFIKKVAAKCLVPLSPLKLRFNGDPDKNSSLNGTFNGDPAREQVGAGSPKETLIKNTISRDPQKSSAPADGAFAFARSPVAVPAANSPKDTLYREQGNKNRVVLGQSGQDKAQSFIPPQAYKNPCLNCGKSACAYPYYIAKNQKEQKQAHPLFPAKEKGGTKSKAAASLSSRIDDVVTNKWLAFPIFILVISGLFFLSVEGLGGFLTRLLKDSLAPFIIEKSKEALSFLPPWTTALLCDGALNGMFSVISFLPQIMLLFGLISCLEASGYMARVVFITDRLLSKVGLSGRSIIPFVTACGCAVPAILSARTIKNVREHHAAVMLCPLMPCSAKTALFAFFTAAVFGGETAVALSMYFLALLAALLAAFLLKITDRKKLTSNDAFIIELPPYRAPRIKNVLKDMWDKGKSFLIKAGTVIFLASAAISFLGSFNWNLSYVAADKSILSNIGRFIAPLFKPLGFGQWQFSVAALSGLAAKETVVSTLQILYGAAPLTNFISPEGAYSFMAFNLLCAPCIAAVTASFKELGKISLGLKALLLQTALAYISSFLIYQGAMLAKKDKRAFLTALCAIALVLLLLMLKMPLRKRE